MKFYSCESLARKAGISRRTIYFYIQMELLPRPIGPRATAKYNEDHLNRLLLINKLKEERFSLEAIRDFMRNMSASDVRQRLQYDDFRILMDTVPIGIFISQDGHFVHVNKKLQEITGFSAKDLTALDIDNELPLMIHEDDRARFLQYRKQNWSNRPPEEAVEFRLLTKFGKYRWFESQTTQIEFRGKRAVQGTLSDITERKEAQAALAKSEAQKSLFLDNLTGLFCFYDTDRTIQWLNKPSADCAGLTPRDAIGRKCWEVLEKRKSPCPNCHVDEILKTGEPREDVWKDNDGRMYHARSIPVRNAKGQIEGVVEYSNDVTEILQSREALLKSEEKYRVIFQQIQDVYFELDVEGTIMEVSPSVEAISGFRRDEVIGRTLWDFFVDRESANDAFRKIIDDGYAANEPIILKGKKGNEIIMYSHSRLIKDALGNPLKVVGNLRDVTDLKRMEEQISEERKRLFKILELLPGYVCLQDKDYRITYANKGFRELFGEPGNRRCHEIFDDSSVPCSSCKTMNIFSTKEPVSREWTDRLGRTFQIHEHLIQEFDGTRMILEIGFEITDRKRTEKKMREYVSLLQSIFITAPVGIGMIKKGVIEQINDHALKMLGFEHRGLQSHRFEDLFATGDEARKWSVEQARQFEKRGLFASEARWVRSDGKIIHIWLNTAPADQHVNPEIIVFSALDITERKRTESELLKNEREYKSLYSMMRMMCDNVPDMIWAKNLHKEYIFTNKATALRLLNAKSTAEPVGRKLVDFMENIGDGNAGVRDGWVSFADETDDLILQTLQPKQFEEAVFIDGDEAVLDVYKAPFLNENGVLIGIVGCGRIVTQEKMLESQLMESLRQNRAMLEALPDSVFRLKANGDIISKYIPPEYLTKSAKYNTEVGNVGEIGLPKEITEMGSRIIAETIESGTMQTLELPVDLEGEKLLFEIRVLPLINDEVLVVSRDMTGQIRAGKDLEISKNRLELAQKVARIGDWIYDPDTRTFFCSDMAVSLLGQDRHASSYAIDEIIDLLHPDDRASFRRNLALAVEHDTDFDTDLRLAGLKSIQWVNMVGTPEPGEKGAMGKIFGTIQDITARKAIENQARINEEKIRNIFSSSPYSITHVDLAGNILDCNETKVRMYGYTKSEMIGMSGFDMVHPDDQPSLMDHYRALFDVGMLKHFRCLMVRKDHSTFPAELTASLIRNQEGMPESIVLITVDLTERHELDRAIRERDERYLTLFTSMSLGVICQDANGVVVDVNPAAESIIGYPKQFIIGRNTLGKEWEYYLENGDPYPTDQHPTRLALKTGKPLVDKIMGVRTGPTPEKTWVKISTFPYKEPGGLKPVLVFSVFEDITEKLRAREALLRERVLVDGLMRTAVTAIMVLDPEGQIVFVNERAEKLLGVSRDDICRRKYDDPLWSITGFEGEELPIEAQPFTIVMRTGETVFNQRMAIHLPEGTVRWLTVNGAPLKDSSGDLMGVVLVIADMSEWYTVEKQLMNMLREKDVLLKEIHHRVKNNLQMIASLFNLQTRTIHDPQVLELFKDSQNRIKSIALIHEKLYQSRNIGEINFREYISGLMHMIQLTNLPDPGRISIEMDCADVAMGIDQAIPCSLIVNELLTNSVKYAYPGKKTGKVVVKMTSTENRIHLLIRDWGVGLPEGFQVGESATLGLQLVRMLARQLGGTFEIHNDNGVLATVSFPIRDED